MQKCIDTSFQLMFGLETRRFYSKLVNNRSSSSDAEGVSWGSWPMYRMWRLRWVHRQGGLADELHPRDGTGERSYGDVEGLGFPENMVIQAYFTWELEGEFGYQLPPPTSELWWHDELCWEARTPTAPTLSSTLQKFYARYL